MMTDKSKKISSGKILSISLYLLELTMEGRVLVHQVEQHIAQSKIQAIVYIGFAVYVIIRLMAFYFILEKRKMKIVVAVIILAVVLSVGGSHYFRSNQKFNSFNYMMRVYDAPSRNKNNYEVFIDAYLQDKDVYIDENSSQDSLLSDNNRLIKLNAQSFNRIVVNEDFILDDKTAMALQENTDYFNSKCNEYVNKIKYVITVYAYMGENYETCQELVMYKDSQNNLYFVPKTVGEVYQ